MFFRFLLNIVILSLWLLIPSFAINFYYPRIQQKPKYSNIVFSIYNAKINVKSKAKIAKNCTLIIVLISKRKSVFDFPQYNSKICRIKETFYYIHHGAGKEINQSFSYDIDNQIKNAKIVRMNGFNDGYLFGLALSIYYPSTYISMIDVDHIQKDNKSVNLWIDESITNLQNEFEISFSNSINPHAVLAFQFAIRRFLLYTDIKYSDIPSMSILYKFYKCRYPSRYLISNNEDTNENLNSCDQIPNEWKCEVKTNSTQNTFAVLIPTFKRNYLLRSIQTLNMQNEKPNQIVIVQNRMHTTFDFNSLEKVTDIPLRHFWCTNWNSYFYLTYSVMMFIKDKYFIKIDDDYFFNTQKETEKLLKFVSNNDNVIGGVGNRINRYIGCSCRITKYSYDYSEIGDFISLISIMYSTSGKIMHRFEALSYLTAEDVSVCLTNAMECNTRSINIKDIKGVYVGDKDGMSHVNDGDFKRKGNLRSLWKEVNCHYILYGYQPVSWISYKCSKQKQEIRFPH